jgi:hypothetical protein
MTLLFSPLLYPVDLSQVSFASERRHIQPDLVVEIARAKCAAGLHQSGDVGREQNAVEVAAVARARLRRERAPLAVWLHRILLAFILARTAIIFRIPAPVP